eukprot:CAMPEP_0201724106 /NCGR_PEP_ID=MMETSP0593-20130828/7941_1 /ASSEMBLY_ACC=CAM_ASM_000672 /TAXON_ID=267983 /ORGANISM="Skeletonema japonicum, Strain CCMP2506" /LENGTH=705 /DNA_ID=CAMNT_0048215301 /DNA_START=260 /DNA_END=2377 /DNA_ORIENTATION=-
MVKLRLPRSPFLGTDSSSANNLGGTRRSRRIQSRRMQPLQHQQQLDVAAMEIADETERRPDNHGNNDENNVDSSEQQSGRSSLRRMFASPGKRKPESRGITASIRRARTTTSQSTTASSSQLKLDMDEDTVGGGVLRERNNTEDTVTSQSEHKNGVPPLSLLSPNSGTFYAHAAANDAMEVDIAKAAEGAIMTKNVLQWMKDDAPPELLPRILSFCGSRRLCALSKVNRKWNSIINDESIWRVMCEDTHKWTDGMQMPESWSDFYRQNPCVPVDYDTLESAFDSISSGDRIDSTENNVRQRFRMQNSSARILLHPGPYFLRKPIVFNCVGSAEVTIESISGLKDPRHALTWCQNYHAEPPLEDSSTTRKILTGLSSSDTIDSSEETKRPSSATLRQMFGCRSTCVALSTLSTPRRGATEEEVDDADCMSPDDRAKFHKSSFEGPNQTAVVVFESSKQNQAIFRVRQGVAHIKGIKLLHYCEGVDIWNGNAAIQVQSPFAPNGRQIRIQPPSVVPTAYVSDCDIVSLSGRGIVNIDGGILHVNKCFIHNSAATGLYLGGRGSKVIMTETDVVENGNGNERNNRGVSRGHSGVYIEQGTATIRDCNISKNSLTGISAVSTDHSTLQVEGSCLQSNGSIQVELPPIGSPSRRRSYSRDNTISTNGHGRPRSRFAMALELPNSPHPIGRHFPPLPQSPSEFPDDVVLRR